ncbi:YutD family protein [Staphylococcus xylosus]|uniref:YutD family protein n=1 Tax=Staphylococcus xylosus TaxID=1288 RepID=UPI002DB8C3C6|nr:YutD family protein [Staphylococcus xylosus]MEB6275714.1 YutD family protein [Staphylococcus xylosus]MEB7812316.1 YutD family protein [Staphylococcus xylosus]MEB7857713.1 YutD family protein [Staphylococcus xylosus]MEB8121982.1 YutD family protein [Staphylococcus xylosus]
MIKLNGQFFEIIEDYRECFDEETFVNRYSDILDKYDFIVGDFGYDQLRLKGFYKDSNKKAELSKRFSTIQDYLLEYCNFGCPYFILRRIPEAEMKNYVESNDIVETDLEEDKLQDVKIKPSIQDTEK